MPQVFQVLRCYKCLIFQVHQTKKSNKFECKMCGEKQSIKRHYGIGNGQECRLHVQKLNSLKGELDESKIQDSHNSSYSEEKIGCNNSTSCIEQEKKQSKWCEFVESKDIVDVTLRTEDKMYLGESEVVLELPNRKRLKKMGSKKNKNKLKQNHLLHSDEEDVKEDVSIEQFPVANCTESSVVTFQGASLWAPLPKTENTLKYNIKKKSDNLGGNILEDGDNNQSQCVYNTDKSKLFNIMPYSSDNEPNSLAKDIQVKTKFIPPTIHKHSKWAKFADNVENDNHIDNSAHLETEKSSNLYLENMFSLCDDSEIDSFLDI